MDSTDAGSIRIAYRGPLRREGPTRIAAHMERDRVGNHPPDYCRDLSDSRARDAHRVADRRLRATEPKRFRDDPTLPGWQRLNARHEPFDQVVIVGRDEAAIVVKDGHLVFDLEFVRFQERRNECDVLTPLLRRECQGGGDAILARGAAFPISHGFANVLDEALPLAPISRGPVESAHLVNDVVPNAL